MTYRFSQRELAQAQAQKDIFAELAATAQWPEEVQQRLQPLLGPAWFVYLLMGIASREDKFGLALSDDPATLDINEKGTPGGVGDYGHGRGEMQIDDRWHPAFVATGAWKDLATSIYYGLVQVLQPNYVLLSRHFELFDHDYLNLILGMVASYNCGAGGVLAALRGGGDVDARTTGRDYSADVWDRAEQLAQIV